MTGELPPESITQGNADASGENTGQEATKIQRDFIDVSIQQKLAQQKAGNFDFDREFGFIRDEDDFENRLWEYEAMNDKPIPCNDFPANAKTQRQFVLRLGKAICNIDRAADATVKKTRKRGSKPRVEVPENEDPYDHDDDGDDDREESAALCGSQEVKPSSAIKHLERLKPAEFELVSWKLLIYSRDAQRGELSRGAWGNIDRTKPKDYNSWRERIEDLIEALETSKCVARALFQKGDIYMKGLVASPAETLASHSRNKQNNDGRSARNAEAKEARKLAASRQHDPSRPSTPVQPLAEAFEDLLAKTAPRTPGSGHTKGGRKGEGDAASRSPGAKAHKQPSTVPGGRATGPRKARPGVFNGGETLLSTPGRGVESMGISSQTLMKKRDQVALSGAVGNGFSKVARSDPGANRNAPPASAAQTCPSAQADGQTVPQTSSSSKASAPTRYKAGTTYQEFLPASYQAIAKYRAGRQHAVLPPGNPLVNEFIPESVDKAFLYPAAPTVVGPSPMAHSQRPPGWSSRAAISMTMSGPPSRLAGQAVQPRLGPLPSQPRGDSGPGRSGTAATIARKKQKRGPTDDATYLNPEDIDQNEEDDQEVQDESQDEE